MQALETSRKQRVTYALLSELVSRTDIQEAANSASLMQGRVVIGSDRATIGLEVKRWLFIKYVLYGCVEQPVFTVFIACIQIQRGEAIHFAIL